MIGGVFTLYNFLGEFNHSQISRSLSAEPNQTLKQLTQ